MPLGGAPGHPGTADPFQLTVAAMGEEVDRVGGGTAAGSGVG